MKTRIYSAIAMAACALATAALAADTGSAKTPNVQTGQAAFTNWKKEKPGVARKITLADLPQPYATVPVANSPHVVPRPANAWPQALPGFKVEMYATDLHNPRLIRTAPNGDMFVAESENNDVVVFRGIKADGKAGQKAVFASGLNLPFGIAFYPPGPNPKWVYVANTDSVVRFPYHNGDLETNGPAQTIVPNLPGGGNTRGAGHWTRTTS